MGQKEKDIYFAETGPAMENKSKDQQKTSNNQKNLAVSAIHTKIKV